MGKIFAVQDRKTCKDGIIAIGQELIRRAEEICNDLENVSTISISALLEHGEVVNFDITKNYIASLEEENQK